MFAAELCRAVVASQQGQDDLGFEGGGESATSVGGHERSFSRNATVTTAGLRPARGSGFLSRKTIGLHRLSLPVGEVGQQVRQCLTAFDWKGIVEAGAESADVAVAFQAIHAVRGCFG